MGGEFSGIRTEEDFLKEFEEIRRESDIHFGSVIIFKNRRNPKFHVLVKEKIILSHDELTSFLEQARLRSSIKAKNVAPLVEMFVHTEKKLCSTSYRAMIGFEFHERTLDKLLRQRKTYENEEAQTMAEVDAWGVLSDLVAGLQAYRERNIFHGDVQPACIFVLNDKTLKLVDSCFMADSFSAYDRRYHDCAYKSPLSPQALSSLTLGPKYASFDREKNDVWAVGITLLVSLTNEDYNIFYDWYNQEVNYDFVLSRVRRVQTMGYSQDFLQALKLMLEKEESRRANLATLADYIRRAPKPMYVSELQDLEVSREDVPVQNAFARQNSTRSNYQAPPQKEIFPMNQYQSNFNTDAYGFQASNENNYGNFKSTIFDQRATAPIMFAAPYNADQNRDPQKNIGRGQSPLNQRFGSSRGQQFAPQPTNQYPVLRDIGNMTPWQEEQRYVSPKPNKQRKGVMSQRNIGSPHREPFPPRMNQNIPNQWNPNPRFTHYN